MGKKQKSKQFVRAEKAKVKLKAKKLLPKGQNVTDTNFKVKKIIIRDQLKTHDLNEPLTHRKLNSKELINRLQHHSFKTRIDSLNGIKELIQNYNEDLLYQQLPEILKNIVQLTLDLEHDVRKEAVKVLTSVVTQVPNDRISAHMEMVLTHMGCAMTHINPGIQEDSLLFLDTLLEHCSALMASHSDRILKNFLNLISSLRSGSTPGRTLTTMLGRKNTTVKWHIKVLPQLLHLLKAIITEKRKLISDPKKKTKYIDMRKKQEDEESTEFPVEYNLLTPLFQRTNWDRDDSYKRYGMFSDLQANVSDGCDKMKGYVESLMPLLLDSWMEVAPDEKTEDVNILKPDAALLLHCILRVIKLMWEYLDIWDKEETREYSLTQWFAREWGPKIKKYFLLGFPFSLGTPETRDVNGKNTSLHRSLALLKSISGDSRPECYPQNLSLCFLLLTFHFKNQEECLKVSNYLKSCLLSSNITDDELLELLVSVVGKLLREKYEDWPKADSVLQAALQCRNQQLRKLLFELLCQLISSSSFEYLTKNESFLSWLSELPNYLCSEKISFNIVKALQKVATCNVNPFRGVLTKRLHLILSNLPSIEVTDVPEFVDGKKEVVNILFWAGEWPEQCEELIDTLSQNGAWDPELSSHVKHVCELRKICPIRSPDITVC